ncbi:hypothetical protein LMH87_009535 [Akanthomyces muscarius]|uniref:Uncharacterized protein n=1 Tax=Akanthomyces muscarius TaxID=2231603 RepID=A0A9W8UJM4_AKAMU|nr:hypothetical protein LMH87_009535 [Akanthomyces muscarius]KAJ4153024.1 hypothetical protein LMH87_009535 [Akanthomyces muscarius]
MQYVAPQNADRQPPYGRLDWFKLTDDAIRNDVSAAIAALHDIKYTGTVRDDRMFPSRPAGKSFRQVSINIRLSLSISRAFRLNKGLPLSGGSYGLMVDYWQAAADLRRKNLADFIVGRFPNDFEKKFGKDIKTVLTENPISHPPAAPYKQLDLAKTLEEAKKIDGLNAADVEDFVNNYVDDYNLHKDGGGRTHADAMEETQDMTTCFRG